jgi:hypothetical protein
MITGLLFSFSSVVVNLACSCVYYKSLSQNKNAKVNILVWQKACFRTPQKSSSAERFKYIRPNRNGYQDFSHVFLLFILSVLLKSLTLSKNKLPAAEGIIRFTNQITATVTIMPKASGVNNPNNCLPASPLIPTSAKGIVGKIANSKKQNTGSTNGIDDVDLYIEHMQYHYILNNKNNKTYT